MRDARVVCVLAVLEVRGTQWMKLALAAFVLGSWSSLGSSWAMMYFGERLDWIPDSFASRLPGFCPALITTRKLGTEAH